MSPASSSYVLQIHGGNPSEIEQSTDGTTMAMSGMWSKTLDAPSNGFSDDGPTGPTHEIKLLDSTGTVKVTRSIRID